MLEFLEFVASRVHCTSVWYPKFKERRSCLSTLKQKLVDFLDAKLRREVDRVAADMATPIFCLAKCRSKMHFLKGNVCIKS